MLLFTREGAELSIFQTEAADMTLGVIRLRHLPFQGVNGNFFDWSGLLSCILLHTKCPSLWSCLFVWKVGWYISDHGLLFILFFFTSSTRMLFGALREFFEIQAIAWPTNPFLSRYERKWDSRRLDGATQFHNIRPPIDSHWFPSSGRHPSGLLVWLECLSEPISNGGVACRESRRSGIWSS